MERAPRHFEEFMGSLHAPRHARSFTLLLAAGIVVAPTLPVRLSAQSTSTATTSNAAALRAVDRAVAAWKPVKTVRASFEQTLVNPLTGAQMRTTGSYQQRRPGQLAVRFDDAAGDRIIADGKSVWIYLPSSIPGQVIRSRLDANGTTGTLDVTAQFLDAPRTRYDITDVGNATISGRATRAVRLVPKPGRGLGFVKATVWIDERDGLIRQFEVVDQSGLSRTVRLTSVARNAAIDPGAFRFEVPAGVRVVERSL